MELIANITEGQYKNTGGYITEVIGGRRKGVIDAKTGGTEQHVKALINMGMVEITVRPGARTEGIKAQLMETGWNQTSIDKAVWTAPTKEAIMKKYLLFAGHYYYPIGGFDDFHGSFDTLKAAGEWFELNLDKISTSYMNHWGHIVDRDTFEIVDRFEQRTKLSSGT